MSITMTIEVSPSQAREIAEILEKTSALPISKAAPEIVQTTMPAPIPVVNQAAAPIAPPAAAIPQTAANTVVPVLPTAPTAIPVPPVNIPAQPVTAPIPTPAAPVVSAPPTAVKKYTADELSLASRPIVEAGRQQELLDLLHSFTFTDPSGVTRNVQNIREMPEELYPAFAEGIRRLGGRI